MERIAKTSPLRSLFSGRTRPKYRMRGNKTGNTLRNSFGMELSLILAELFIGLRLIHFTLGYGNADNKVHNALQEESYVAYSTNQGGTMYIHNLRIA